MDGLMAAVAAVMQCPIGLFYVECHQTKELMASSGLHGLWAGNGRFEWTQI